jgi:hypothetical protein
VVDVVEDASVDELESSSVVEGDEPSMVEEVESSSVVEGDEPSVDDDEPSVVEEVESSSVGGGDEVVLDDSAEPTDGVSTTVEAVVSPTAGAAMLGVDETSSRGWSAMSPATIETAPNASPMATAVARSHAMMSRTRPMPTSYGSRRRVTPTGG